MEYVRDHLVWVLKVYPSSLPLLFDGRNIPLSNTFKSAKSDWYVVDNEEPFASSLAEFEHLDKDIPALKYQCIGHIIPLIQQQLYLEMFETSPLI